MDPEGSPPSSLSPPAEAATDVKYCRSSRSLHSLAIKFFQLLLEAEDGEMDLRKAANELPFGKRRIYDIINVLEGIGFLVKISRNRVKWTGALPKEFAQRMELWSEMRELEQKEFMLDQKKHWVEENLRNLTEECNHLMYVNHDDICNSFSDRTLLAVHAPPGTGIEVPIPKAVQHTQTKYQIYMKSTRGPINVVLLNKRSVNDDAVVIPVPPPEEMLERARCEVSNSASKENRSGPCSVPDNTKHSSRIKHEMPDLSKGLRDLIDPSKGITKSDLITQFMVSRGVPVCVSQRQPLAEHSPSNDCSDALGTYLTNMSCHFNSDQNHSR
ncbi:transcription factor E2F5-like [Pholidichthys leucotaenia]